MWRSIGMPLATLLVAMLSLMEPAFAQRQGAGYPGANLDANGWELLGSARIGGYGVDRDLIEVGGGEGRFDRLLLRVRSGHANIMTLRVVFGNGTTQDVRVNDRLRDGEQTKPINLEGESRIIKNVEIVGRARKGRAVVELYGLPAPEWELIGKQRVAGYGTNLDTIIVPPRAGPFSSIRLKAVRQNVYVLNLRVAFNNGKSQVVRLKQNIRKGESTRPLKLDGYNRGIEHIELVYRGRPGSGRRGVLEVYGEKAKPARPPKRADRWEKLGCQKVGFGADRDVIRVGRNEGRFNAIRLRVSGNSVYMIDLKVIYGRGQPDDIQMRRQIRAGTETRPLDLRGEQRAIKQIEMVYSSVPGLRGQATVCADGRK